MLDDLELHAIQKNDFSSMLSERFFKKPGEIPFPPTGVSSQKKLEFGFFWKSFSILSSSLLPKIRKEFHSILQKFEVQ